MESKMESKKLLYPLMVIAAISVILFSIVGIATMTGKIPKAESENLSAARSSAAPGHRTATVASTCSNCGVVESIRMTEIRGQGSGLGAVTGGVVGGILGNQVGGGDGRTVATLLGAAGGAYVGNNVERESKKSSRYVIRVRMDDGTVRTLYQAYQPAVNIGEKVKVINGSVAALG